MSLTIADDEEVLLTAGHIDATQASTTSLITWKSSNVGVVSMDDNGDGTAWAVAKSPGTARITATAEDSGKESPAYEIDVTGGATDSVVVTAGAPQHKGSRIAPPVGGSATVPTAGGGATGTAAPGTTSAPIPGASGPAPGGLAGVPDPGTAAPVSSTSTTGAAPVPPAGDTAAAGTTIPTAP